MAVLCIDGSQDGPLESQAICIYIYIYVCIYVGRRSRGIEKPSLTMSRDTACFRACSKPQASPVSMPHPASGAFGTAEPLLFRIAGRGELSRKFDQDAVKRRRGELKLGP